MKKPQIKYFADGVATAAARVNAERRQGVWQGMAAMGVAVEDGISLIRQKRLAVHLAVAVLLVQLVSLAAWSSVIAIAVFAVPTAFAAGGAVIWFGLNKDHTSLRWLLIASGFFYTGAFFVSESCTPIGESGGRVFAMALPTVLFHVPAGGSLFATIVASAGHLILYVLISILETSLSDPCFGRLDAAANDPLLQVFLQLALPVTVTIVACVAQFRFDAADAALREDAERFAVAVLAHMENGDFRDASNLAAAYVTEPGFLPYATDLALQHALSQADGFKQAIPLALVPAVSVLAGDRKTPEARSTSPSATANANRSKGPAATATPPASSASSPAAAATPQTAAKEAPKGSAEKGKPDGENLAAPGHGRHGRSFVAFTDDDDGQNRSISPLVTSASQNVSRRGSENMPGAIDSPRHDAQNDGEVPAPGGSFVRGRRRSTQGFGRRQSMRTLFPMQRTRTFIVAFSLPRMALYLSKPRSQPEMARLMLTEYREHIARVCSVFNGKILFTAFNDVIVTFDTCASATAASTHLLEIMDKDNQHHIDPLVKEALPHQVMAIIVNTDLVSGVVGNDPATATTLGWSPAEAVFAKVKHHFAQTTLSPPIVLIADTLTHLIEGDFILAQSGVGHFSIVEASVAKDHQGLPLLKHSRSREAEEDDEVNYDLPDVDKMLEQMVMGLRGADLSGSMSQSMGNDSKAASAEGGKKRKRVAPEVMQMWRRFDADGNGHLDPEEIREVLAELGIYMNETELRDFFNEVDRDGSGTISLDEFTRAFFSSNLGGATVISGIRKAAANLKGQTGVDNMPMVVSTWKRYDKDGSGSLEAEEIAHVLNDLGMAQAPEEVEWLVKKLDSNGNGTVDFEEFAALFSEDVAEMKDNIVKQRIQTVARVMENRANQEVFSNDDQLQRERLIVLKHRVDLFMSPILFLYIVYNFGQVTYRTAMGLDQTPGTLEIAVDMSLDSIFIAFVLLKVLLLPRDVGGHVMHKRAEVLKEYVFSIEFLFDVCAVLPVDVAFLAMGDVSVSGPYAYYRLNKLATMYHFDERFMLTSQHFFSPVMNRIVNALAWFVITCHVFACGVILLARNIGEARMLDMVGSSQLISKEDTRYLLAILWAFQTLAGQLRGEALPPTDEQLVLMILAVIVGLPIFATLLAVIGNAVTVQTTESMFLARVDSLRSYFSYAKRNMAESEAAGLETESIQYYRHLFETTGSLDIQANPLQDVPMELLIQVTVETGLDMLRKVPIFEEACENVEFVHEITTKMVPRVIEPGMVVMRKGERGSNMYFITYGDFNIVVENVGVVFTLRKGNFFGEIALLHNVKRTATIVCDKRRYANVLTLEKRDFDEVLQVFPQCLSAISKAAGDRLKQILDQEAEEQRQAKLKRQEQSVRRGSHMSPNALSTSRGDASAGDVAGNPLAGPTISGPYADDAEAQQPDSPHETTAGPSQPADPDPVSDESSGDYEVPEEPGEPPGAMRAMVEE